MKVLLSKDLHLFTNITLPYMPNIIDNFKLFIVLIKLTVEAIVAHGILKRLIGCPQFVGKIFLTCILFTDRVILAVYHCIEEHNFNCKLPVGFASPRCFRFKF